MSINIKPSTAKELVWSMLLVSLIPKKNLRIGLKIDFTCLMNPIYIQTASSEPAACYQIIDRLKPLSFLFRCPPPPGGCMHNFETHSPPSTSPALYNHAVPEEERGTLFHVQAKGIKGHRWKWADHPSRDELLTAVKQFGQNPGD